MARKRRQFSKEYKTEVCRLIESSGKSVGQVARELAAKTNKLIGHPS